MDTYVLSCFIIILPMNSPQIEGLSQFSKQTIIMRDYVIILLLCWLYLSLHDDISSISSEYPSSLVLHHCGSFWLLYRHMPRVWLSVSILPLELELSFWSFLMFPPYPPCLPVRTKPFLSVESITSWLGYGFSRLRAPHQHRPAGRATWQQYCHRRDSCGTVR